MRTHCDWFAQRADPIWKASPGKSFLILSPHGLPETQLASLLKKVIETSFVMPNQHSNARPVVLSLSPDTTRSSRHFVKRVGAHMAKACSITYELASQDDPSDALLDIVETALDQGIHLILIIERFHAFVDIVDDDLLSTLSTLRTLEHDSRITTIAITPKSYAQMRRQMPPSSAFVNSSYGDNHDRAIPSPLTKEEFLAVATARGLSVPDAQRLFQLAGGPDLFCEKLIEAKLEGAPDVIGAALTRLGDHVQTFMANSFPEVMSEDGKVLARLGLGNLTPLDYDLFQSNPLKAFVVKEGVATGRLIASTPILGRWALRHGQLDWRVYEHAMIALRTGDAAAAAAYVADSNHAHPRLKCFSDAVQLLAVLDGGVDSAMLSVEWDRAVRLAKAVVDNNETPPRLREWATQIMSDARKVTSAFGRGEMIRLDKLTVLASDPSIEAFLLNATSAFVAKAKRLQSPTATVKALATIPEAILQSIAAARCGINYASAPRLDANAPFGGFFAGPGPFVIPEPGRKLDLTALLVIVPTLLEGSGSKTVLSDRGYVVRLQSKLVTQLRNVVAHTSATFEKKDAEYLIEISEQLLEAWRVGAGTNGDQSPFIDTKPTASSLASLLYGDFDENAFEH